MSKVLAGITVSLDGYVTGPNDRPGAGLGEGGERLHYWVFGGPWTYAGGARGTPAEPDRAYLDEAFGSAGAWIVGRTMHDVVDGWGEDPGFGVPVFVVTSRPHAMVVKGDTTFEFLTGGIREAHDRATAAAGEQNVLVMGGADVLRQFLAAGLVDELIVYQAPTILGSGKNAVADLGIRTLADAQHWDWDESDGGAVRRLGADLRLHLVPAATATASEKEIH